MSRLSLYKAKSIQLLGASPQTPSRARAPGPRYVGDFRAFIPSDPILNPPAWHTRLLTNGVDSIAL